MNVNIMLNTSQNLFKIAESDLPSGFIFLQLRTKFGECAFSHASE